MRGSFFVKFFRQYPILALFILLLLGFLSLEIFLRLPSTWWTRSKVDALDPQKMFAHKVSLFDEESLTAGLRSENGLLLVPRLVYHPKKNDPLFALWVRFLEANQPAQFNRVDQLLIAQSFEEREISNSVPLKDKGQLI